MKRVILGAAAGCVVALSACGVLPSTATTTGNTGGHPTPMSSQPSPTNVFHSFSSIPTPSETPSSKSDLDLTFTGSISGHGTGSSNDCNKSTSASYGTTYSGYFTVMVSSTEYDLHWDVQQYGGAGTYVSKADAALTDPQLSAGMYKNGALTESFDVQDGSSVTIGQDEQSGSVDMTLLGSSGNAHMTGTWTCSA